MYILEPLNIRKNGRLEIDASQEMRWESQQIEFFNRDYDVRSYVNSVVAQIAHAYWVSSIKLLVVVSAEGQVYLLNERASRLFVSDVFADPVLEVALDEDNHILAIRTANDVEIIDYKIETSVARFNESIQNFSKLMVTRDLEYVGFSTSGSYKIYGLESGALECEFKVRNFQLLSARQLANNTWLTFSSKKEIQWWDAEGREITTLDTAVSIHSGIRLLDSGHLLCMDDDKRIFEVDTQGKMVAAVGRNRFWSAGAAHIGELCDHTTKLLANMLRVENAHRNKSNLLNFCHIYSAIGLSVDSVERENAGGQVKKILTGGSPKLKYVGNERIWNFFYRPKVSELRSQFIQVMRDTASADHKVRELKDLWQSAKVSMMKAMKLRKGFALVALIAAVGAGGFAYLSNGQDIERYFDVWEPGAAALALLFMSFVGWRKAVNAKRQGVEIDSALSILDTVHRLIGDVKSSVKSYRMKLVSQLPRVGEERPTDAQMRDHINALLDGKIRSIALDECGLDESDVNSIDAEGNPIKTYINEPAYLQFTEEKELPRGLNPQNLLSFFLGPNDEPIFAVQFIQFFFLGAKKIDAFTCFYDFINDEMVANEAHTFYYRDVTNISKRQLDMANGASDAESLSRAKVGVEMKLVVASSDNIRINIATDETYRMMNAEVSRHASEEMSGRVRAIEDEIRSFEQNTKLSDEEKAEEIADLQASLDAVKAEYERRIDEKFSSNNDTSQRIIQYVRGRLRELKEA
ncbi:MAG: hypothetical protein M1363_01460 [Gammaproteobacteria bacterium]|nr:hypothetical protein [Gammaproteobacteria bacterium]